MTVALATQASLVLPPCSVAPIPPLDDEEAQRFEQAVGTAAVVDRDGLTPATAMALSRFEQRVAKLGGILQVTSAYRPPAYQAHLEVVWDKRQQLADNHEEGCSVVKGQVQDEFERHQLRASQRPAPISDHTLGLAFDASVLWRGKPRFSIDRLAAFAGVRRPAISHDPVHFKLAGVLVN